MKMSLKIGFVTTALVISSVGLALKAGSDTQTLYAITNLGPDFVASVSNPDASGMVVVVGSSGPLEGRLPTVWTVGPSGTVEDVFTYDTLGFGTAKDVNDHGMMVGFESIVSAFVDVPGV